MWPLVARSRFSTKFLAVVVLVAADMILLPWMLWEGPYQSQMLIAGLTGSDPRYTGLAGEWMLVNVLAAAMLLLTWANRKTPNRSPDDASTYGSHGTTRLARPAELRDHLKRSGPGLILGRQSDGLLILPPDPKIAHNQNVTVLGSSGTRKTRAFVQPNLLQEACYGKASLICVDPKAENYRRSAMLLKENEYEVRLLNFLDMAHSDQWNPLDAVQSATDAADLAVNLVANTTNPHVPVGGDPFWHQSEQSFITALVLYIKYHRPEAEQHMASVLELGAELHPDNLDRIFLALSPDALARRFYRTFLRADIKVKSGVVAGIGSRLQLWNVPEIVSLTAASHFKLSDLGRKRMALFLVIPDSKPTYAPILALFWQQVFQVLYGVADQAGGALKVPVQCVMDEIANCGYIPDYAQKKSTMRSRRISTEEVWQSLGQLRSRYPHSWSELLANSDHLLLLGVNDLDTAQYISQLSGTTTISVAGTGSSEGSSGGSTNTSLSYQGRPLLTPDECRRLPIHEALLFPKGQHPARVHKVDYTAHKLAGSIKEEDHRKYAAPDRPDTVVTNVAALLDKVVQAAKTAHSAEAGDGCGPRDAEPGDVAPDGTTVDPSQFIDVEPQV